MVRAMRVQASLIIFGCTSVACASSSSTANDAAHSIDGESLPIDARPIMFDATPPADALVNADAVALPAAMTIVSVSSSGTAGDGDSGGGFQATMSGDAHFVTFYSDADNLIADDTNAVGDVFLHDDVSGTTTRVSIDSKLLQTTGVSHNPAISIDGRYIAFQSAATNLFPGDNNGVQDIYLRDTIAGNMARVSIGLGGADSDGFSALPWISQGGRFVAFFSGATNLVAGDTNSQTDVFIRDMSTNVTSMVSVTPAGVGGNGMSFNLAITPDARFVAFSSYATDLVDNDTNGKTDVFVRDLQTGITTLVSVDSNGEQADGPSGTPAISNDGRYIAFASDATNLVSGDDNASGDLFVRDMMMGTTVAVSVSTAGVFGDNNSYDVSMSGDGRYVVFDSVADNLAANDGNQNEDVFLHDVQSGMTTLISANANGNSGNGESTLPSISNDGAVITFLSSASDLVAGDSNGHADIFRVAR